MYDTLNLQDPSTPARKITVRSVTEGLHPPSDVRLEIRKSNSVPIPTTPMLMLQIPSHQLETDSPKRDSTSSPIVPPRTTSLHMPRPTARPTSMIGSPYSTSRHASSPLRSRNGPIPSPSSGSARDTARLRTLHRSVASSSEPSLIPNGEGTHACEAYYSTTCALLTKLSFNSAFSQRLTTGLINKRSDFVSSLFCSTILCLSFYQSIRGLCRDGGPWEGACLSMLGRGRRFLGEGKDCRVAWWTVRYSIVSQRGKIAYSCRSGRINKTALRHYVNFFDFAGLRLDMAFR